MSSTAESSILRDVTNAMTDGPSIAPKRSLFKKPNWAAKSASVAKADTDLFDHRESTYSEILAEKEKKREKYRAKAATQLEDRHGGQLKRRRLSEDEDSDFDTESSDSEEKIPRAGPANRSTPTKEQIASPDPPVNNYSPFRPSDAPTALIIDLERDENGADPIPDSLSEPKKFSPIKPLPKPPLSDPESEDEDEYTLELKRRAREKLRLQKLGLSASDSRTTEPPSTKSCPLQLQSPSQLDSAKSPSEALVQQSPPPPAALKEKDEAIVRILIRSAIPQTNELIVNRRVSQNLQHVKEAWCKRQGFDAAMTRKVFLTWRGNKLFNTTTCTHILRNLKAEKKSRVGILDSDDEDSDPSNGRIEVEAVTEDILIEREKLKEREDRLADVSNGHEGMSGEEAGEPQPQKEPDVQLMLNSPGLESVLLKVRPTTLVSKVMAGFKKIRDIEQGKTCWLIFDGERLDPETRIADTEIEDGDAVDVQIR
jgi:Ubiquitin-2 like Rad60 SUMO-like